MIISADENCDPIKMYPWRVHKNDQRIKILSEKSPI